MKRLANFKGSTDSGHSGTTRSKKTNASKNNPYPSSRTNGTVPTDSISSGGHLSFATHQSEKAWNTDSAAQSKGSLLVSRDDHQFPASSKSAAPTVSTKADTTNSDTAQSKAGTVTTNGGALSSHALGGEGSTFSSPAPSVRSLTTTLTTIQSAGPATVMGSSNSPNLQSTSNQQAVHFSHQFPTSSPASAIPSHVVGSGTGQAGASNLSTYSTATANNLLTDNASILTLASSSKARRRRNSLDTNASVRALAPSSIFGGSRESLPLSVLSGPVGDSNPGSGLAPHNRPSVSGMPPAERASVYSSSGAAPALSSERNSYYANKQNNNMGDGGSMRSGRISHGRNDSITGSIGGAASPLASPRETVASTQSAPGPGRVSHRNSLWEAEVDEEAGETEEGKES